MLVVKGFPPNYAAICAAIDGVASNKHAVFTYGETVYTIDGQKLPGHLIAHEAAHIHQQKQHDGGPAGWWDQYLDDSDFRLDEELQAYRVQYRVLLNENDRKTRRTWLDHMARTLAGSLYGRLITKQEARTLIMRDESPSGVKQERKRYDEYIAKQEKADDNKKSA